jgi:metacaspase-1
MWRARRRLCAAGLALAAQPRSLPAQQSRGQRRALLIGVCDYYKFPNRRLEGPANDVPRMRALLQNFGFTDIQVVADQLDAGTPAPTRANILNAFTTVAERTSKDDLLFFYFAGHGAQQPVIGNSRNELDGLDEVLLPADAGRLTESLTIQNAIVDDEVGHFISACRARGAFVWAVVDACHSGDSTRDAPLPLGARTRGMTPSDFGMPRWVELLMDRFPIIARSRLGQLDICGAPQTSLPGELLAFFACRSNQRTIELPMPGNHSSRRYTGLFTHVLLNQLEVLRAREATYLDLIKGVERKYAHEWQGWDWQPQFCADPPRKIAARGIFR